MSWLFYLAVFYCVVIIFVAYWLLCSDADCSHLGPVGRLHRFLTRELFSSSKYGTSSLLNCFFTPYFHNTDTPLIIFAEICYVVLLGSVCTMLVLMLLIIAVLSPIPSCRCTHWLVLLFSLVQLLYLSLVLGGYFMFIKDAFPRIPGPYLSYWHR